MGECNKHKGGDDAVGHDLSKITEARGKMDGERRPEEQTAEREMRRTKSWPVFVWQQQAEEPQGHANERGGLSAAGGRVLLERGLLTDTRPQRGEGSAGEGEPRGSGK